MHLVWQNQILLINDKKFTFTLPIKKAFMFDSIPIVLTDTIIFIEEIPFSPLSKEQAFDTKVTEANEYAFANQVEYLMPKINNCFKDDIIYYQIENKIFSLEHQYSDPEFLFYSLYELLEVTSKYFIFGNGGRLFLKEKQTEFMLEIVFFNNNLAIKNISSEEISDSLITYNGINFIKVNDTLVLFNEKYVYFLEMETLNVNTLEIDLKMIEIVYYNSKYLTLINDDLFDNKTLIKPNVSCEDINTYGIFDMNSKICQNFVKIKQSRVEKFEKNLAKSSSPHNYIKTNIHWLDDAEYIEKLTNYYLNPLNKQLEEDPIIKIPSPTSMQDYLLDFDPSMSTNLSDKKFSNEQTINKNETLNFNDIFNKNLPNNKTFTNNLKRLVRIKQNIQLKNKIFKEIPNIQYLKKISSLNLMNLDTKTKEALLLCFEAQKNFLQEETDLENKRQKIYKLKKSAQSPLILYSSLKPSFISVGFNNSIVRILMIDKSNYIGMINLKENESPILTKSIPTKEEDNEIYKIINNQVYSKDSYTAEEIAGLILGLGINKSYHHIFSSDNDFINSMSLIAVSLTSGAKKDSSLITNLKVNNLVLNTATVISIGYSFEATNNAFIIELLIKEANKFGCINKQWYDEIYRLIAGYSIVLVHKKNLVNYSFINYKFNYFIEFNDKLTELIVNGILFWNSKNYRILSKLKRNINNRLEEVFYSEVFINGITNKEIDIPSFKNDLSLYEIYKLAGKYFYLGIYTLLSGNENDILYKRLRKECLLSEQEMFHNKNYKVLFDILLVTLCIIYNGTNDLKILKILRRNLNLNGNVRINDFINGKFEINYFFRYGDYLRYKMCIGLLFSGLGRFRLNKDCLLELIYAFYINFPFNEEDQKVFSFFRHNLVSKLIKKDDVVISDWSKEDKRVLFDLFSNYYEEVGEVDISLGNFIN
ncbi:hypothetical protein H312_01739 [Anncaliia algerae PRA339]|uniref:Anaphase-promoting complex subunit 1 n=1 Tax=Anncaliia algerae PRA339 TaxID=1288291 RepID=A0A059F1K1_9MICR|nr:hypothetical protein H312_01739 [Anncaliia algerae PRA339]